MRVNPTSIKPSRGAGQGDRRHLRRLEVSETAPSVALLPADDSPAGLVSELTGCKQRNLAIQSSGATARGNIDRTEAAMNRPASLLDELRTQYEAARDTSEEHSNVESYQAIDARLRKAFRWLEKAMTYLSGLKPPINHRFDVGHGFVFDSPRFGHGSVGMHEHRIVGFPVIDEINIYYEIAASKPLSVEVAPALVEAAEKALDEAGLQYTSRRVEAAGGGVHKCSFSIPPAIPAVVSFRADYQTGIVTATLVN